jgi:hypothetical protein
VRDSGSASIVYSLAASGDAFGPVAISPNGQKVAYVTNAASTAQLVVLDWALNTNWVIASYQGNSTSLPWFSADSRFLAYVGSLGSSVYTNQIYLYDFQTGTNLLVSQSYDGVSPGNDQSDSPDISSDEKFVSYRSAASNLVPGDTNEVPDIFLYDRSSGATALITGGAPPFSARERSRGLPPMRSAQGPRLLLGRHVPHQSIVYASLLTAFLPPTATASQIGRPICLLLPGRRAETFQFEPFTPFFLAALILFRCEKPGQDHSHVGRDFWV